MGSRIFKEAGISVEAHVLPLDEFRVYLDMESQELVPEYMERVVRNAEAMLTEDIPFMPLSLYREFFVNGNRANFESRFFRRRDMAMTLAMAEYYEGNGRFTDKLADVVWAILEETSWMLPAHTVHSPSMPGTSVPEVYNNERLHGIDLFSATTAAMLTAVHHYAGAALDTVSPLINERLVYEIKNRAIRPYINTVFSWTGLFGNKTNNWNPWITSNLLYVTAMLENDTRVRRFVARRAAESIDNFTFFYPDDGGCDEGPGYWSVAGASLIDCLETIYDMTGGKVDMFSHPLVRAIGEYVAKVAIHKNRFINFADSHGKMTVDGCLLMRMGRRSGSDMLLSFGATMRGLGNPGLNASCPYRSIKNMMTPKVAEIPPSRAARLTYLPGLKIMVSRESEDTAKGMFVAMKGGHNGESHNHNDVGSFIVYYGGEPVLIDVGVGTYTKQTFSPDRYKIWFMQSNYHNLPTFDSVGQMQGGAFASRDESYDEESGAFSAEIGGAYPKNAGVISYRRGAVLEGDRVRVSEDIKLDGERKICFHFMSHVAPVLKKPGEIALAEGRVLRYPEGLECEIEQFYSEGLDAKSTWGSENLWRIHLHTRTSEFKGEFVVE